LHEPVELLAVDDSATSLEAIRAVVEPLDAELTTAASGEEALRHLLHEPDIAAILLDIGLPGMDGFETAAAIRRRMKTRYVPIIFVTGQDTPERSLEAYSAGAVDYIVKPFDAAVLRSKLAVFIDLHRLRKHTAALTHRALHDVLTGLPNRELFQDRLEQALARARRRTVPLAVLFVDLDGFKQVNDVHGHKAGDDVLVEAGERLRALVRTADTVSRYGGDEFTVLAEDVGDVEAAQHLGERIADELSRPYPGGLQLGASVGVAFTANPAATSPDGLIRRADHAMYRSKRPGAGRAEVSRVRPGLLSPTSTSH
jgi:diguanylate cyclase (GGDEF)-like protein